jgi:hypothetical protein
MHQRPGFLREVTIPLIVSIAMIVAFALVVPRCGESARRELIEAKLDGRVP